MAVTNKAILDTLESMPDAIAQAMVTALNSQTVAPATNGASQAATDTVVHVGQDADETQPTVYTYFLPKNSVARQVADAINKLEKGQELTYSRAVHGRINEIWGRSSYKEAAFDNANRRRVLERQTSKSGKTVADGNVIHITVPPKKLRAPANRITVKLVA